MKNFSIPFLFAALMVSIKANAQQDIHFSQFYSSPLMINPATTGMFNGTIRGVVNYREQWRAISDPYQTFSASFDAALFRQKMKNGFLGAGAVFYNDRAGASRLTTGSYGFSFSYAIELERDMYLSIGVQPLFLQKSIDVSALYFDSQYTGTAFNQALSSGETYASQQFETFDLSGGVYYLYRPDKRRAFYAGVSGAHLTAPVISFLGTEDRLLRKYTVHGGGEFALDGPSRTFLLPNALVVFQGPNRIINFGSDVKYVIKEQSHFTGFLHEMSAGAGAYYRVGDAFWGTLHFSWTGFTLAMSYDVNLSGLSVATRGRGGMELMLMYRAGIGHGRGKSTRFL